jgi:hypothetical protein
LSQKKTLFLLVATAFSFFAVSAHAQWTTDPSGIYYSGGQVLVGPLPAQTTTNKLEIGSSKLGNLVGNVAAVSNDAGNSVYALGQSSTARGRLVWIFNALESSAYLALGTVGGSYPLVLQDGALGPVNIAMTGTFPSTNSRLNIAQIDGGTGLAIGNPSGVQRLALNGNSDGSWTAYDFGTGSWSTGITQKGGKVGIGAPPFGITYPIDVHQYIRIASNPADTVSESAGLILSNHGAGATGSNVEYQWQIITGSPTSNGVGANGLEMWEYPNPPVSYGCCLQRFVIKKASATTTPAPFVIDGAGKVGIGVANPAYALDVNGTIHATQVIGATYQDVAEWVPATTKMTAGTVVVVQRGSKNTVAPSASAYATAVAGVVSEKPGLILGEGSDAKAMIATTGRVKVHVDASNGAIEAGDLLVTSDRPGLAMKSQPVDLGGVKIHRPGTLIGKALEPLPSGEGDILVLLSLQ